MTNSYFFRGVAKNHQPAIVIKVKEVFKHPLDDNPPRTSMFFQMGFDGLNPHRAGTVLEVCNNMFKLIRLRKCYVSIGQSMSFFCNLNKQDFYVNST